MAESRLHLSFTFTLLLSTSNRDANIVDSVYAGWVDKNQMSQESQSMSLVPINVVLASP